jgi:glycosyltransferase involved in cell wall biosynthesis
MRLGIAIQETWGFFEEIYADLASHYETNLFRRRIWKFPIFHTRINRYIFHRDLQHFMQENDVVLFEWASELLAVATRLPKSCGIVTRLHRYEMYGWVNRINWDAVDKIIVVSQAKKKEFIARYPNQESKLVVSSPSISLEKFTPSSKKYSGDIGTLCHLSPRKRVYELILTLYELLQSGGDFHLHIGGSPEPSNEDYYHALQYLVDELELREKVTFYGNVTDPKNWYSNIDIFISNSYSEGLQVALMEAMASGCYCLSHRWDGVNEMLPGNHLYYSERELVQKIINYSESPGADKQAMRRSMREIACEKFDINQTKAQFRQAIEAVGAQSHHKA